jgi:hypothetical protein
VRALPADTRSCDAGLVARRAPPTDANRFSYSTSQRLERAADSATAARPTAQRNRARTRKGKAMIIEVLLVVTLFLWFLALLPIPQVPPFFVSASGWMAWIAVLLLALFIFLPGLRG